MVKNFYRQLVMECPIGYACQRIVFGADNAPYDYEFIEVNSAFEALTGISAKEIVGKRITEILPHLGGSDDWLRCYEEVALHGSKLDFEHYSKTLNRWLQVSVSSLKKDHLTTFLRDITSEKEQTQELSSLQEIVREVELKYTAVANYAYEWETWEDENGDLKYISPACERISGYTAQEFMDNKKLFESIILEDDRKRWRDYRNDIWQHCRNPIKNQGSDLFQFRIRHKNGNIVWIERICNPVIGEDGSFLGFRVSHHEITERKRVQEELQASKQQLADIIDFLPDATLAIDKERRVIIWNKAIEKMTGIPAQNMLGKGDYAYTVPFYGRPVPQLMDLVFQDFSPEEQELILSRYHQVSREGDMLTAEVFCPALNHQQGAWVYAKVSPLHDHSGQVIGAIESIRDITEKKQWEESLQQKTAILEAQINSSLDGIVIDDVNFRRLYTNRRYYEMFNIPEDLIETEDHSQLMAYLKSLIPEPFTNRFHYLHEHPFETSFLEIELNNGMIMEEYTAPVIDKSGKHFGRIWTFHDITERKKLERDLAREKNLLETTLISVGDGVISTDKQGKIVLLNKMAETLTGWTQEEAKGKPLDEVFVIYNELTKQRCKNIVAQVLESGKRQELANHTILYAKNGIARPIEDSAAPIRQENGEIIGVVLVFRDFTEKKQKQQEIEYLSYHDLLTGLYNRRFYEEELKRLDTKRNLPITIIMGDVNGLKLINDSFGHAKGDELLKKVAAVLKKGCRADDIIARLGGDEFVILLPKTDSSQAEVIIKRITELAAKEKVGFMNLSISFGYDTKYHEKEDITKILKNTEDSMYRHKLYESSSMRSNNIDLIMKTLYEKSSREMFHSGRVGEICEAIAVRMGFPKDKVNQIRVAGLMHDIGKIGIEENLLNKPGTLSPHEWKEIMRHAEIGYRILSSVNEFSEIAGYILEHHERWDGKGYPKGLKGEEISMVARIIAVADAFDAMTTDRTYSKAMSDQDAIREIKRCSGTHFDPEVVRAFIETITEQK